MLIPSALDLPLPAPSTHLSSSASCSAENVDRGPQRRTSSLEMLWSERIQTTQIHPNGMPLQNTYLTGRIKIVANDGLLKWPQTLSKEAGHPTRMKSSSRVLNDMELDGHWSLQWYRQGTVTSVLSVGRILSIQPSTGPRGLRTRTSCSCKPSMSMERSGPRL